MDVGILTSRCVWLVRDVDPKTIIAIEENRFLLPGVFIEVEPVREYLCGNLASHFLGYLGLMGSRTQSVK